MHKTDIEIKEPKPQEPVQPTRLPAGESSFNGKAILGFVLLFVGAAAFEGFIYVLSSVYNRLMGH